MLQVTVCKVVTAVAPSAPKIETMMVPTLQTHTEVPGGTVVATIQISMVPGSTGELFKPLCGITGRIQT